jgi:protoporphyrin/coproporphyrin ferrochelatase
MDVQKNRTGVLLIQLGTPDSPSVGDVRSYLRQFLSDPRVIDIPFVIRMILVHFIIAPFRAPKSAKIYKNLWKLGGNASPLKTITHDLTQRLNQELNAEQIFVHMAMRYKNPSLDIVLEEMRVQNYNKMIILPLFPHYASSSSGSAIQRCMEIISKWWVIPNIEIISQFYNEDFYIQTLAEQAQKHDISSFDHVLMSYHGLPDRHVDKVYEGKDNLCSHHNCETVMDSDNTYCYKATAYETSRLIAKKLDLHEDQYTVSFQSRLDDKWLTPFSDRVIEDFAKEGKRKLLVFSPAFVADCLETYIEIGDEYQEIFEEHGGEKVQLVESCNTETTWVNGLTDFIKNRV